MTNNTVGHGYAWLIFLFTFIAGSAKWRSVQFDNEITNCHACI